MSTGNQGDEKLSSGPDAPQSGDSNIPASSSTLRPSRSPDLPRRLGAPRRWFHGALFLVCLAVCWAASVPGGLVLPFLLAVVGLLILGVVWLVRLILWLMSKQRPLWPFLIAPAVVLLLVGLVWFDVPLRARFELSRPAMTAFVQDHSTEVGGSQRVGLYEVIGWKSRGAGMVLPVGDGMLGLELPGLMDDNVFAYLPDGPASLSEPGSGTRVVLSLGHDWYTWTQSW
ncbi:MAG: hypothetical protein WAN48_01655 [Actinomycetes bacterium]